MQQQRLANHVRTLKILLSAHNHLHQLDSLTAPFCAASGI